MWFITSKSDAMVLWRKKVYCSLQVGSELRSQAKEFGKHFGNLFMSDKHFAWDGQVDCCSISSNADIVPECYGEEGAESEGKGFDLPVDLLSNPHPWSWALGSDRNNEIVDTSSWNFLCRMAGLGIGWGASASRRGSEYSQLLLDGWKILHRAGLL